MKRETNNTTNKTGAGARRRFRRVAPERVATTADLAPEKTKVRISIMLDLDILNHFKRRATEPDAAAYQTQINNELRRAMASSEAGGVDAPLLNDERFIKEVAARVAELRCLAMATLLRPLLLLPLPNAARAVEFILDDQQTPRCEGAAASLRAFPVQRHDVRHIREESLEAPRAGFTLEPARPLFFIALTKLLPLRPDFAGRTEVG